MHPEMAEPAPVLIFTKYPTNFQSNLFTESRQEFTEMEKKIVTLVVNQLGHMAVNQTIPPDKNVVVQIPFIELSKTRYDQVVNAADGLNRKRIAYRNDSKKEFTFLTPFPVVVPAVNEEGNRVIEITLLANVVPYFAALGQRYTKYDLDVMMSLSSVYAQRMFEIVSMFINRKQKQFTYEVEELRTILNCPESYRFNDFVMYALEVSQRELFQKADLILEWTPSRKIGRKVVELKFEVKSQHQIAEEAVAMDKLMVSSMPIADAVHMAYQLMANYKLKPYQKEEIASDREKLGEFFRLNSEITNNKRRNIRNPTAYLVKSLGIDQVKETKKPAPKPTKAVASPAPLFSLSPTVRANATQSIGSILGGIPFPDSDS